VSISQPAGEHQPASQSASQLVSISQPASQSASQSVNIFDLKKINHLDFECLCFVGGLSFMSD
jgi:hypothetical protein